MKVLSLKEIQAESLKVLLKIDELCRENNIEYTLAFGTLLGAIRHKGYIPWDDDVDVCMKREDYDRFVRLFEKNDKIKPYKLCTRRNTENYFLEIPRFCSTEFRFENTDPYEKNYDCGIFVDIYPLDYCDNSEQDKKDYKKLQMLFRKYLIYVGIESPNPIYRFIKKTGHILLKHISKEKMLQSIEKDTDSIVKRMASGKHRYLTPLFGGNRIYLTEAQWYDGIVYAEYEGYKFPIPAHYEEILKYYYNDYMKLPPQEERAPYHKYKIIKP